MDPMGNEVNPIIDFAHCVFIIWYTGYYGKGYGYGQHANKGWRRSGQKEREKGNIRAMANGTSGSGADLKTGTGVRMMDAKGGPGAVLRPDKGGYYLPHGQGYIDADSTTRWQTKGFPQNSDNLVPKWYPPQLVNSKSALLILA